MSRKMVLLSILRFGSAMANKKISRRSLRPKKVLTMDAVEPVNTKYQVSRSLPDLRDGPRASQSGPKVAIIKKPKAGWKKIVKKSLVTFFVVILLIAGYLGFKLVYNSIKTGSNIWSLFGNSKLKGEDRGRVNILLAGDSSDDPGHAGASLTDSIMLVSINTKDNTAFMLSIPRDLYVNIPNDGYAKINAVAQAGDQQKFSQAGYPDGGMGMLESVVSAKLDIPIDYYALINYTAFRDGVNAVGGVTVNIKSQDPRGLFDSNTKVRLPLGPAELNGQQALDLARSRGDGYGSYGFWRADFDRTTNQRMLLLALKNKAASAAVLANPIKVGQLFDAAGNNVKTDLSLGNLKRLYSISKKIDDGKVASVGLNDVDGKNLLRSYTGYGGQSALIPAAGINSYEDIQAYVAKLSLVSQ